MEFFQSERLNDLNVGKKKIAELKESQDKTVIVHYSCESFFNTKGRTPRVTSICVKTRGNNNAKAFSIHLQAQIQDKDLTTLTDDDYDALEKEMLKEFYDFVKKHKTYKWVHWNMRNASYGFEAIANRYKILKGKPTDIEDQFKYDLPDLLGLIYTYKFEAHKPKGQLLNLADRNQVTSRDALTGKDEANAFDNKQYLELHMSTMRKVEVIDRILTVEEKNQLKVGIKIYQIYGLTPKGTVEIVKNNVWLFAVWSLLIFIAGIALEPIVQNLLGIEK